MTYFGYSCSLALRYVLLAYLIDSLVFPRLGAPFPDHYLHFVYQLYVISEYIVGSHLMTKTEFSLSVEDKLTREMARFYQTFH